MLTGGYGLAQYYCPTEIDTTHRRNYNISAAKLQKALRLNPLNGGYWVSLVLLAQIEEVDLEEGSEISAASVDSSIIDPWSIPGWKERQAAHESLPDWAFGQALSLSPAASEFWVVWADHLWDRLLTKEEKGERGAGRLLEQAAQAYTMAVELAPDSPSVRRQAEHFFLWQKGKDLPED